MRHARRLAPFIVALLLASSCATLAPGADPVVVRTEQFLTLSDGAFKGLINFWFAAGVAPTLTVSQSRALEKVRTGYDAPYKRVQFALDRYKFQRAAGIRAEMAALRAVLQEALDALGGSSIDRSTVKIPELPAEVP